MFSAQTASTGPSKINHFLSEDSSVEYFLKFATKVYLSYTKFKISAYCTRKFGITEAYITFSKWISYPEYVLK
jgi:hypothetical protein